MFHAGAYRCASAASQVLGAARLLEPGTPLALQGKVREAYELLVPVYGWFPEGFDTLDLREAKTLLNELPA